MLTMEKKLRALGMALGMTVTPILGIGCGPDEEERAEAEAEAEALANQLGAAFDNAAEEAAAEAEAEAGEGGDLALGDTGLKVAAPAGSQVRDAIVGDGYMIQGPGLVMTIKEAGESAPADLAAAKEANEMYSPQNVNEEELEDGYILTFTNTGGMGDNFWVVGRREVNGKTVMCETTASSAEQQAAAVAACKSIHG